MWRKISSILIITLLSLLLICVSVIYIEVVRGQETDRFKEEIDRLENKLRNPNLSIQGHIDVLSRLEGAYAQATFRTQGYIIATMKSSWKITPVPETFKVISTDGGVIKWKPPDGISDDPEIHNPIFGYDHSTVILNSWRKTTTDYSYLIYAGYVKDNPKLGMVLVPWREKSPLPWFRQYLTPKRSGGVRVVDDYGLYVVLQAENGDLFYFDPVGEKFTASLDAPTMTPTPVDQLEINKAKTPSPEPYP